jgi:hypothetical protein
MLRDAGFTTQNFSTQNKRESFAKRYGIGLKDFTAPPDIRLDAGSSFRRDVESTMRKVTPFGLADYRTTEGTSKTRTAGIGSSQIQSEGVKPTYSPLVQTATGVSKEIRNIENIVAQQVQGDLEMFIHSDPCVVEYSCKICSVENCTYRKAEKVKKLKAICVFCF